MPRAQGRTDGVTVAASRGSKMGGALQPLPANYRMETPIQSLCQSASAFDYKNVNICEFENGICP